MYIDTTSSTKGDNFSQHARLRMAHRGLPQDVVDLALRHGRHIQTRGAYFVVVGKREVSRCAARGVDISAADGVHCVCAADDPNEVLTVYRNRDLRRLQPSRPCGRHARHRRRMRQQRWHMRGAAWIPQQLGRSLGDVGTSESGRVGCDG